MCTVLLPSGVNTVAVNKYICLSLTREFDKHAYLLLVPCSQESSHRYCEECKQAKDVITPECPWGAKGQIHILMLCVLDVYLNFCYAASALQALSSSWWCLLTCVL